MLIKIRKGENTDIEAIMSCYDIAKQYMRKSGNLTQWINGYPSRELIIEDINRGINYVGQDEDNDIVMVFAFIIGNDPTYNIIENGEWLDESPYGTIHRLASTGKYRGILKICIDYCLSYINNIRLDTHADNLTMQKSTERLGFKKCGIIYCQDSTPRIAYQKIKLP